MAAAAAALVFGILIGATARRDDGTDRTAITVSTTVTSSSALVATSASALEASPAAPATRPPGEVRVAVLNGARQAGAAGALSDALGARGFAMAPAADAEPHPQTTVYERADEEPDCEVVRAAVEEIRGEPAVSVPLLDPPQIPGAEGMSCVVVVGRRFV